MTPHRLELQLRWLTVLVALAIGLQFVRPWLSADDEDSDRVIEGASQIFSIPTLAYLKNIPHRKLRSGSVVYSAGYHVPGDGGGGLFYWTASNDLAEDGGLVFAAAETGRWKRMTDDELTVKHFGARGDGVTDDTRALQAAMSAGRKVRIKRSSTFYRATSRISLPGNAHVIFDLGAEIKWMETVANGPVLLKTKTRCGFLIEGSDVVIEGAGKITGPNADVYINSEVGLFAKGRGVDAQVMNLQVRDVEVSGWGAYGIAAQFAANVSIERTLVHHCGYSGIAMFSATNLRIHANKVHAITPGVDDNAYGISLTHDSSGYDRDPNRVANGRLVRNPFCVGADVAFNEVYDIPVWTGIDSHGGYELRIHSNAVYNCYIGINAGGSSGAASGYAGENNSVFFNVVTTKRRDGSATTIQRPDAAGIVLNGGSVVPNRNVRCLNNVIDGYGGGKGYCITAANVVNARVSGNVFRNWRGLGIYTYNGDGVISENIFGSVAVQPASRCIYIDSPSRGWLISGNRHNPGAGAVADEGLRFHPANSGRNEVWGNDFATATSPVVNLGAAH